MFLNPVKIRNVYSFVASTILLDLGTPSGEAMAGQLHSYACQKLQQGDSEFKRLYRRVEKEETPSMLGTGMSESVEGQGEAFLTWLKSKGIDATDQNKKKKIAIFSGDAQNPQTGLSFKWSVCIYFDMDK